MSKPINLRQIRKQQVRDEKRAKGDANAAKFGEARHDREARRAEHDRAGRAHDAHKRDD
ncbi:DUF4169 family protein [Paracoccus saliphilus]|uniref:DUF4169 family protein n=1 Tax=Paracoccus saliphilus TaxID=405559 RepID=A0ABY7S8Y4_9RHOB|nr:DUF4169 family protein [Paracoccus saliphilus]WCR03433.1 DUF4169 family protein [Paracoccus saliphilus]